MGALAVVTILTLGVARPAGAQQNKVDLTQVSIENRMNVEVSSVSKKEQKLSRTAAAVLVMTQEDIRESGATGIPDLLRMVPARETLGRRRWYGKVTWSF
jgi:iron complex outermembrane recepter protein